MGVSSGEIKAGTHSLSHLFEHLTTYAAAVQCSFSHSQLFPLLFLSSGKFERTVTLQNALLFTRRHRERERERERERGVPLFAPTRPPSKPYRPICSALCPDLLGRRGEGAQEAEGREGGRGTNDHLRFSVINGLRHCADKFGEQRACFHFETI